MQYFAYGSNMLEDKIIGRCKSARFSRVAKLDNYCLKFNKISIDGSGKANIEKSRSDFVWGVVYEMSNEDINKLDVFEKGYQRTEISLIDRNGIVMIAQTYISEKVNEELRPTKQYLKEVVDGAIMHKLPEEYIMHLKLFL